MKGREKENLLKKYQDYLDKEEKIIELEFQKNIDFINLFIINYED